MIHIIVMYSRYETYAVIEDFCMGTDIFLCTRLQNSWHRLLPRSVQGSVFQCKRCIVWHPGWRQAGLSGPGVTHIRTAVKCLAYKAIHR